MKILMIPALLITTLSYAQQVSRDTVYLEWRGDKFFEVTETVLDNGQRSVNERPIGDSTQTLQTYLNATEQAFTELAEAAKIMIRKNAIVQSTNKYNTMLFNTFNSDIVTISVNAVKESLVGDFRLKMPERDIAEVSIDDNLQINYDNTTLQIIPVGTNYIQVLADNIIYELYRLDEGQYASIDTQVVLLKQ